MAGLPKSVSHAYVSAIGMTIGIATSKLRSSAGLGMKSRVRNLALQVEPWYDYGLVVEKGDNVMQIQLPPELLPFVEQEYATGRYSTREEVVVQALRWFREERQEAVAGIKQGLDDVAAGRTQPLAEAFADIRKEFGVPET